ncbi:MAG: ABC transporter ATP-binding protein [Clostridia bacterium]|nr:ABC transporter ATP-binding protein [Clostridia bacterium]
MSENRRPSPPSGGSPFGGPGSGRGPGGGRPGGPAGRMMPGEKAKDLKGSLKKLVKMLKAHWLSIVTVCICAILSTVFNTVGPKISGLATTEIARGFAASIAGTGGIDFDYILNIIITLFILYMISAIMRYFQSFIMTGLTNKITYGLRKDISEKINRMPLGYFDRVQSGEVLSRITNDVETVSGNLNQSIVQVITSVTTLIGVVIMMLTISPIMTLIAFATLPFTLIITKKVVKLSQPYFIGRQKYLGQANGHVEEMFSGHVVVKAFNREDESQAQFEEILDNLYEANWKSQFYSGIMMPLTKLLGNIGYVLICIVGSALTIAGKIGLGDIQAFTQYMRNFTQPIQQIANISNVLQSTAAAAERVFEFLDEEEEVRDKADSYDLVHKDYFDNIKGEITFDHVHFGYLPGQTIINDFSIKVEPGKMVAIVGPTGAGKTTIVKLLMRYYDVNSGSIKVDGVDIRDFTRNGLRDMFGMVLQDTWLYNGTIADNIRYGRLDATDEDVKNAAKAAQVHHFVKTLPDGYNMILGEDATNISQGQKQLLTIARAILSDPKILILDEATSSVDTRTEILIQKAMANLMKGRTSFVIAHRLSTIRDADMILVMRDGDIVEVGNHDELIAKGGFYKDLYQSQFEHPTAAD